MANIKFHYRVAARPEKVYKALTEEAYIRKWWTPDCSIEAREHTTARFEFNPYGDYVVATIEKLEPNKLVKWKVTDSRMLGTDDWVNTRIIFTLQEEDAGTEIDFAHKDWRDETECFQKCTEGWAHFARDSLKRYLETGRGMPHEKQ